MTRIPKSWSGVILGILLIAGFSGCNRPKLTSIALDTIDTSQDPIQVPFTPTGVIIRRMEEGVFSVKPLAQYRISARVVSRETYSGGWEGLLSPIDLVLAWGKVADLSYQKYINVSQGDRWYFYRVSRESPLSPSYVEMHSSNNHILPASDNVWRALMKVKTKEKVNLEGFLVQLTGTYHGSTVNWNTSLSRTDTGNGSCELFFVSKARIESRIYE